MIWQLGQGEFEQPSCVIQAVFPFQAIRDQGGNLGILGNEGERLFVSLARGAHLVEFLIDIPQVLPRLVVGGAEAGRVRQHACSFIQASAVPQQPAKVEPRVYESRIQLDGLAVSVLGLVRRTGRRKGIAQVGPIFRLGTEADRAIDERDCIAGLAREREQQATQVQEVRAVWLGFQGSVTCLTGSLDLAVLCQMDDAIQFNGGHGPSDLLVTDRCWLDPRLRAEGY